MRTSNLPSGALRVAEAGLIWEELLTNAAGTLELPNYSIFRVRAAGAVTVTINGKLAMTMTSGEIQRFNTGDALPANSKPTVTVTIVGNCYLQSAREVEHKRQP